MGAASPVAITRLPHSILMKFTTWRKRGRAWITGRKLL
jgi:hypothetical protein